MSRSSGRVTLKDLAAQTGYTVNTVSRALKNKPDIAPQTCRAIQQVARRMGYVPNRMASALRQGRSGTLALIVGNLVNPFFGAMVTEVENAARAQDLSVLVLSSRDNERDERRAVTTAVERQADGVLLCPSQRTREPLRMLEEARMPFVLMARDFPDEACDSVGCDEAAAGFLAARHLIEAGHRRIAVLYDYEFVHGILSRVQGCCQAVREAGLPDCLPLVARDAASAADGLTRLMRRGVTGCVAYCDLAALSTLSELERRGVRMPDDLAMVGFDNLQASLNLATPLCSVAVDVRAQAQAAVGLLLGRVRGEEGPAQKQLFPTRVVCRGSCALHRGAITTGAWE